LLRRIERVCKTLSPQHSKWLEDCSFASRFQPTEEIAR
jgi:hypothetical protein